MSDNYKKRKKSICFLLGELLIGGVENVLINTLKLLHNEYDMTVFVLCNIWHPEIVEQFPEDVTVICGNYPNKRYLFTVPYMSRMYYDRKLKNKKFDYMISMKGVQNSCFSNRAKIHIFWDHQDCIKNWLCDDLTVKRKLLKRYLRFVYRRYDAIWTVADQISNDFRVAFKLNHVYTLSNPIDCDSILKQSNVSDDIEVSAEKTNIMMLGRFSDEKGFERVIRMFCAKQRTALTNFHIYLVGEGILYRKFKALISDNGLSDIITIVGRRKNPYGLLQKMQLLICPSYTESFGLVLLEAMLLKVPIITTNTTGGCFVTETGKYAICIDNDDEQLERTITNFILNPHSYNHSLEDAQKRAFQFDLSMYKRRLLELLECCDE